MKSLFIDRSRYVFLCCGEFPAELIVLKNNGEFDSGEDVYLMSSSCDGIVIVKVGVDLFDVGSVPFSSILFDDGTVWFLSDVIRINGFPCPT